MGEDYGEGEVEEPAGRELASGEDRGGGSALGLLVVVYNDGDVNGGMNLDESRLDGRRGGRDEGSS